MTIYKTLQQSTTNVWRGNPNINGTQLGQGINGFIPPYLVDDDLSDEMARIRYYLRDAFNTNYTRQKTTSGIPAKINTPFRLSMNAGDPLSRVNYSCGGTPAQVKRPQNNGMRSLYGNITSLCDGSGVQAANCNIKYVYDASDYIKYKRNFAVNKNYNNLSNGGNDNSAQQVAWKAVRRNF